VLVCRTSPGGGESGCCRLAGYHPDAQPRPRRYPTDLTDAQWALLDPLLPEPAWAAGPGGRPEAHCRRQIVDAILYVVDNGIKWRALPSDFPPWQTVYSLFRRWEEAGASQAIMDALRARERISEGRAAAPSAAVIDSASVKGAPTVGASTRGYDAGKKVNGRKRHIGVDTMGLLLWVLVTPANVQDRDGAKPLLEALAATTSRPRLVWADGGHAGKLIDWCAQATGIVLQIVKRTEAHVFKALPRRWVVERTLAWIARHRRCAKDYERLPLVHETMVRWSMIHVLLKRRQRVPKQPLSLRLNLGRGLRLACEVSHFGDDGA
jgi:transposase